MVEDQAPTWLDILLKGAAGPQPPELNSDRIKELAGRGILTPRALTPEEIQDLSAAIIGHLISRQRAGRL